MPGKHSIPDIDFRNIRPLVSEQSGFEEFCCQLARRDSEVPTGSRFVRLRGEGGDGGVECYWVLKNGDEWGYQAKLHFALRKSQIEGSIRTAIDVHPRLKRYTVCLPFDLTGQTGRKRKQGGAARGEMQKWDQYVAEWRKIAASRDLDLDIRLWTKSELRDRLLRADNVAGRLRFWFGNLSLFDPNWFSRQIHASVKSRRSSLFPKVEN